MFGPGGEAPFGVAARMEGHGIAFVEDLHHAFRSLDLHFLTPDGVCDAVVMFVKFNVVIDVDVRRFPYRKSVGFLRQWTQLWLVDLFEQLAARFAQMLHFAIVERFQQRLDGPVGFGNAEKGLVTQRGQHPALDVLDAVLGQSFVARLANAGG